MFRGGDYVDDPRFSNPNQIKNSMDVSDIAGTKSKQYGGRQRDNMNVSDINGMKPPLHGYGQGKPPQGYAQDYSQVERRNQSDQIAGVRYRPRTGERGMADIFSSNVSDAPRRIENRSLQTNDIVGASSKVGPNQYNQSVIAGVRTGSPARKNDSSVFAHLTDSYERGDALKRKDLSDISKPRVVQNNLSAQRMSNGYQASQFNDPYANQQPEYQAQDYNQQAYGGQKDSQLAGGYGDVYQTRDLERDELAKQFDEYQALQEKMRQQDAARNYQMQLSQQPVNGLSGFTKNQGLSSNILAHDIIDVKSKGNLANNGNQIFNSGGYSSSSNSKRMIQEQKFEQNFQKPMADRSSVQSEYMKNNQLLTAAGVPLTNNSAQRRPTINDGKERLFGAVDENTTVQSRGAAANLTLEQQRSQGKRILQSGGQTDSYSNVIGGYPGIENLAPQTKAPYSNQRIVMMSHVPIPGMNQNYGTDYYGGPLQVQE
ncbi:UNKNOWN [Stylonychia lemnae]|uniref:Uncharacterized protein n=1 Tax=Stylonychia lemnae TaxID=5949 RepID=A0A077ZWV9_STYLE|nr:UNKNOWN [Stylonychia lemnae]|eukprot:CDW74314.1 UNKNOWN [Stylonychia lemnae]